MDSLGFISHTACLLFFLLKNQDTENISCPFPGNAVKITKVLLGWVNLARKPLRICTISVYVNVELLLLLFSLSRIPKCYIFQHTGVRQLKNSSLAIWGLCFLPYQTVLLFLVTQPSSFPCVELSPQNRHQYVFGAQDREGVDIGKTRTAKAKQTA